MFSEIFFVIPKWTIKGGEMLFMEVFLETDIKARSQFFDGKGVG